MSLCVGCIIAAGSVAGVSGLGRVSEWWAERQRQKAMKAVLDEPSVRPDERQDQGEDAALASEDFDRAGPSAA
jgi:hypothetical protein